MEFWDMYLITRLDGLIGLIGTIQVICGIIFTVLCFFAIPESYDNPEKVSWRKRIFKTLWMPCLGLIIFTIIQMLIPTSKQVMAFYAVDVITHEEKVIDTADKLYEVLDGYLDSKIEEKKEK